MNAHGIDISVLSLANPWLDFLEPHEAASTAVKVNDDINRVCNEHPGRLYAFGVLPLSAMTKVIASEVQRLKSLKYMRGVIIGTTGLGRGLDDPSMDPIWQALEDTDSVTRMYLSGVWDRFPGLKMLIAHSGGTLPFLAGRIESCIAHDTHLMGENKAPRRNLWEVLRQNIYLDAVIYSEVGLKAAVDASGADRLLFGTDHPFFPPLDESKKEWLSVTLNGSAVNDAFEIDKKAISMVMGGNALRILQLTESVP